jgi:hypothetical protein
VGGLGPLWTALGIRFTALSEIDWTPAEPITVQGEHMTTVIHSAQLVTAGTLTPDAWIAFTDGVIDGRGTGTTWRALGRPR